MTTSNSTGGRHASLEPVGPFLSNASAFDASLLLLRDLGTYRPPNYLHLDSIAADAAIRIYAKRLSISDSSLTMVAIRGAYRLDDERLVLVIFALASYYGCIIPKDMQTALRYACGYDPFRLRRAGKMICSGEWIVRADYYKRIYPSEELLIIATNDYPITDKEENWMLEDIRLLPTILDRE